MVAFQISNTVAARIQLKWSLSKETKRTLAISEAPEICAYEGNRYGTTL